MPIFLGLEGSGHHLQPSMHLNVSKKDAFFMAGHALSSLPRSVEMNVFYKLARNDGFFMLPRDHEHFAAATTNAITADDYDHFMQGKKNYSMEELKTVPAKYHSEIKVFVKKEADKLRPHGQEDHDHCTICSKLLAHEHPGIRSTGSTGHGYTVKIPKTTTLRCLALRKRCDRLLRET
jgi:hypothetical protein